MNIIVTKEVVSLCPWSDLLYCRALQKTLCSKVLERKSSWYFLHASPNLQISLQNILMPLLSNKKKNMSVLKLLLTYASTCSF